MSSFYPTGSGQILSYWSSQRTVIWIYPCGIPEWVNTLGCTHNSKHEVAKQAFSVKRSLLWLACVQACPSQAFFSFATPLNQVRLGRRSSPSVNAPVSLRWNLGLPSFAPPTNRNYRKVFGFEMKSYSFFSVMCCCSKDSLVHLIPPC